MVRRPKRAMSEFMSTWKKNGHGSAAKSPRVALLRSDCSGPALARALQEKGSEVLELPLTERVGGDIRRFQPDTIVTGLCPQSPYRTLRVLRGLEEVVQRPLLLLLIFDMHYEMLGPYMEAGVDDVVDPPHSAAAILLRRYIQMHGPGRLDTYAAIQREVRLGSLMIDVPRRQLSGDGTHLELSGREFELLLQLVEAGGEVVPRGELLTEIWGASGGSEAVLDATVHRLRRKLDQAGDEGSRVATVRGVGYQLQFDSPGSMN